MVFGERVILEMERDLEKVFAISKTEIMNTINVLSLDIKKEKLCTSSKTGVSIYAK